MKTFIIIPLRYVHIDFLKVNKAKKKGFCLLYYSKNVTNDYFEVFTKEKTFILL
jgi:predicted enzyme involved in methoxymalonyl-ACP biosynthesis